MYAAESKQLLRILNTSKTNKYEPYIMIIAKDQVQLYQFPYYTFYKI